MRSVEQSLLRTGLDRLDILLIHDCDVWTHGPVDATVASRRRWRAPTSARQAAQREDRRGHWFRHQRVRHLREVREGRRLRCGDDGWPLFAADPERRWTNSCRWRSKRTSASCWPACSIPAFSQPAPCPAPSSSTAPAPEDIMERVRKIEAICAAHATPLRRAALAVRDGASRGRDGAARRGHATGGAGQLGRCRQHGAGGSLGRPAVRRSARSGGADAWRVRARRQSNSSTNCRTSRAGTASGLRPRRSIFARSDGDPVRVTIPVDIPHVGFDRSRQRSSRPLTSAAL